MTDNSRKSRIAGAIGLVTALVAVFAALGGIGVAQSSISAAQYQYGQKKVTICHKGKQTIRVGKKAAIAHMRKHSDTLGACERHKAKKAKKAKKAQHKRHDKAGKAEKKHEHTSDRAKSRDAEEKAEARKQDDKSEHGKSKSRGGKGK